MDTRNNSQSPSPSKVIGPIGPKPKTSAPAQSASLDNFISNMLSAVSGNVLYRSPVNSSPVLRGTGCSDGPSPRVGATSPRTSSKSPHGSASSTVTTSPTIDSISPKTRTGSPRNGAGSPRAGAPTTVTSQLAAAAAQLAHGVSQISIGTNDQFARLTRDRRVSYSSRTISPSLPSTSTGTPKSRASPFEYNSICSQHVQPYRFFCRSCAVSICNGCSFDHQGHEITYINDDPEETRERAIKLTNETRTTTIAVRNAMESVQRMSEKVEMKAFSTATEIRNVMRKFIAALEARELELLRRVDQGRQIKLELLGSQMEQLHVAYTRLSHASDYIGDSLKNATPSELAVANHQVTKELAEVGALGMAMDPCQDDDIVFIPPNQTCLSAINNIGTLKISSSAFSVPFLNEPKLYLGVNPFSVKSRPIYGAPVVVVKDLGGRPCQPFGSEGEKEGELCRPWGVCCNRFGHFIVADRSNNRVQVFDSSGNFMFKFGSQGTLPGQFDRPAGIAVNPQDDIVVADKDNHRIQVFRKDGTYLLSFGEKGTQIGQFQYPWDVACDSMGNILVSDTRNHRIQLFTWNGIFIAKYGFEGPSNMWKHFDSPRGVCFHPSGEVIVTDFNNHRLVVIDASLTRARYIGEEGSNFAQFNRPQGVACDDRGNIIVADSRNNRIQVFNDKGEFLWSVGQLGKGNGDLDRPSGICFTEEGRMAVVDFGNNRVQIF